MQFWRLVPAETSALLSHKFFIKLVYKYLKFTGAVLVVVLAVQVVLVVLGSASASDQHRAETQQVSFRCREID